MQTETTARVNNSVMREGSKLLVIYTLITLLVLCVLIICSIATKGSGIWIGLYIVSSIVYFAYGWYLVKQGRVGYLRHLVEILIAWTVIYIIMQAVWVIWSLTYY